MTSSTQSSLNKIVKCTLCLVFELLFNVHNINQFIKHFTTMAKNKVKYNHGLDINQTFYGNKQSYKESDPTCDTLTDFIKEINQLIPDTLRMKVERTRFTVGIKFVIAERETDPEQYSNLIQSLVDVCDELKIKLKPMKTKIE